mmetsp:Transcript_24914/g.47194  ORF Transcript_24914/g.47194 Transcript_24914/m.47194 type:complete len:201 (-) Transcript_24914:479-1081(-)
MANDGAYWLQFSRLQPGHEALHFCKGRVHSPEHMPCTRVRVFNRLLDVMHLVVHCLRPPQCAAVDLYSLKFQFQPLPSVLHNKEALLWIVLDVCSSIAIQAREAAEAMELWRGQVQLLQPNRVGKEEGLMREVACHCSKQLLIAQTVTVQHHGLAGKAVDEVQQLIHTSSLCRQMNESVVCPSGVQIDAGASATVSNTPQ